MLEGLGNPRLSLPRSGVRGVRPCGAGVPGCSTPGCGNGFVDPGEQCDDGLPESSCCSESCQREPAGTGCESDANVCTDDVCDASGTCQHEPNTAPCPGVSARRNVQRRCVHGRICSRWDAVRGRNARTQPDQCNALGTCVSGVRLSWGACEVCESSTGCVARPQVGCQPPARSWLALSVTNAERRSAKSSQRIASPPSRPGASATRRRRPTTICARTMRRASCCGPRRRRTGPAPASRAGRMGKSGNRPPHGLTNVAVRESGKTVRVIGPRSTPQNRPIVDGSKPANEVGASRRGGDYRIGGSSGKPGGRVADAAVENAAWCCA